jgi:alpha-D-ribose 1-methylphosphonate 5-phosphate C-P lyase
VTSALDRLLESGSARGYGYAYLDAASKREVRRALLKAVCLPGHLVPFASRDMPVARGWGSGGLQVSLSTVVPEDTVKVIDQGSDSSMNAIALRDLVTQTADVAETTDAREATLIQTRHRIPEDPLREEQVLVFQVPVSDPLRRIDPRPSVTRRLHAERDYAPIWLYLYEDHARVGHATFASAHPAEVEDAYVMTPSPIPRHDVPRLDGAPFLSLFGAGREAVVYAVPPYSKVRPLAFEDRPFEPERAPGPCARCGATDTFLVEDESAATLQLICSDTDHCARRREGAA